MNPSDFVDPNHPIGNWVRLMMQETFVDPQWAMASAWLINGFIAIAAMVILPVSLGAPFLIWMERKVCAHIQARLGPMRVGFHGSLQSLADVLKLLFKEIVTPSGVDKLVYYIGPILPLSASFMALAVIPWAHNMQVSDPSMGVIYLIAVSGLGIFGILMGAWASNNKYSLVGGMRAGAQMISYEISLGVLMMIVVVLAGSTSLREIVLSQTGPFWCSWWIFKAPVVGFLTFICYLVSSTAELNRGPFDIAEAEQEITAGYHTEYSGMAFAMFFLAEYVNMMVQAALMSSFFLGGFLAPQIGIVAVDEILNFIPGVLWLLLKMMVIIFIYMWFRWTFPRPRIDQLLDLEWKFLLPVNLLLLIMACGLVAFGAIL
jgi:NADH-quinone oxidoreductase subunit H